MRSRSTIIPGLVLALVVTACTGSGNRDGTVPETATSSAAQDPTTTTSEPNGVPTEPITTAEVAETAITTPDGYASTEDIDTSALELIDIGLGWVPDAIVAETAYDILSTPSNTLVSIVSVIPAAEWRGAPDLPEMLVGLLSRSPSTPDESGIVETETAEGLPMFLWSTGDGFLIALADEEEAARAYLRRREALRVPIAVWADGSCLMVPGGDFPYAPFPMDFVVPCTSPHNAEVIAAEFAATTAPSFDADTIEFDRTFACDQAYSTTFGPDIDHRPGLVTYMPDEAEWDRGDRYRACVVSISTKGTTEVFEGAMADREDLVWNLKPGDCLPSTIKEVPLECSSVHVHEFMGLAVVPFDKWPSEGDAAFDAACERYLDHVVDGPTEVGVWAYGLGPYEFAQGARSVRCLAFAIGDAAPTLVGGSFTSGWRLIGDTVSV